MLGEWARRGVLAVTVAAWGLMVLDALPWGLDLDESGSQGLVRCVAVLGTAALLWWLSQARQDARPAAEVYSLGWEAGYEAGRRAAADSLRARLGSHG